MGVAAQWMAYQRRMGHRPGPLGAIAAPSAGSGEQPSGLPQVELYIGGWIDVTALGLVRYSQGIHVTRGQPDENQKTNPATAAFRLANLDGRFSPRNPLGPYYGMIDKNTPCRISVQSGNSKSYRFWGEISSWPQSWDGTGNDAWVDIQASGILRRLGTGQAPLRSAPYTYWANPTPGRQAVAYWPMEDASAATQFASGVAGAQPMTIVGAPSMASLSSITASDALPSFTTGSGAYGRIPAYTPAGSTQLSAVTCYVVMPSGGETSQTLITFGTTGSLTWELYYVSTSGGQLGVRGRDSAGNVQCDAGTAAMSVNGLPVAVGLDFQQADASNVSCDINVVAVSTGAQAFTQAQSATFTAGRLTSVRVAPSATLTGTTVGHIAISVAGSTLPIEDYLGNLGELAAIRFARLCGLINIQSHVVFNSATNNFGPAMGPQHSGAFLDLLQECVDADGGVLFELTDRLGLGYRCRDTVENQTAPVLALDYSQAQLADVPDPVDDDTFTRNDITATRLNGSSTRAVQSSGPLNTGAPPAGVGTYATSITVNVASDAQVPDQAWRRLHFGTLPEPRYPSIGVELARTAITSSSVLRSNALALMPGDRMTIANPPSWLPPDTISAIVLGFDETFNQYTHRIKWNTMPESVWRVAVADDAVFGRADSDGSALAAAIGPTDITMQVSTTNAGSPLWTTSAGDFPFDVMVGGERMTVTGVSGATSPQTFNVTRSVNGVVKPQAVNTAVSLYQPAILSM